MYRYNIFCRSKGMLKEDLTYTWEFEDESVFETCDRSKALHMAQKVGGLITNRDDGNSIAYYKDKGWYNHETKQFEPHVEVLSQLATVKDFRFDKEGKIQLQISPVSLTKDINQLSPEEKQSLLDEIVSRFTVNKKVDC